MEASTGIPFAVSQKGLEDKPMILRVGTKLKKKLSAMRHLKKHSTEQHGHRRFTMGLFMKGTSHSKDEGHRGAEGNANGQQRATTISHPQSNNDLTGSQISKQEGTEEITSSTQTSTLTQETPPISMSSGDKAYVQHLKEQETKTREERSQRRLARRAERWCKGGPLPSLGDFDEMSPKQISDYLRLKGVSEEWIQVVMSQIEYVREKDKIAEEVEVTIPPSTWPWDENYTIAMTLRTCIEDGMSYSQIGYFFYRFIYRQDDPIDNAVTKLKDGGYSFTDMGEAMIDLFATRGSGKGLVITEAKPYVFPGSNGSDSEADEEQEEEEEKSTERSQSAVQRQQKQDRGQQRQEGPEQRHQTQPEVEDWYYQPERLEGGKTASAHSLRRSITPPPELSMPKGYKMVNGKARCITEPQFCVSLHDEPPANLPTAVRGRRKQYVKARAPKKKTKCRYRAERRSRLRLYVKAESSKMAEKAYYEAKKKFAPSSSYSYSSSEYIHSRNEDSDTTRHRSRYRGQQNKDPKTGKKKKKTTEAPRLRRYPSSVTSSCFQLV